ncbi:hypothetical protein LXA43DRAFT_1187603 [Ganoderma leucocontextum]|nr:hypothetical protein LXA43DRAFT_1187603 [Ganoderma leucocontextum]
MSANGKRKVRADDAEEGAGSVKRPSTKAQRVINPNAMEIDTTSESASTSGRAPPTIIRPPQPGQPGPSRPPLKPRTSGAAAGKPKTNPILANFFAPSKEAPAAFQRGETFREINERRKREAAAAAELARRAPWVYDLEWPQAYYDLNGDAFPDMSLQAVNVFLGELRHVVLATHWFSPAPMSQDGQKLIADVVPLVLERALREEGFTGPIHEFTAKIKVHPIPQSNWVMIDCLGKKAQAVLEAQAAVYNRELLTTVIFRKLEKTPPTSRIITATDVKRTPAFEDLLRLTLEKDTRLLGGSTFKSVKMIGRQRMNNDERPGHKDTNECYFRVELGEADASRVYDKWGAGSWTGELPVDKEAERAPAREQSY